MTFEAIDRDGPGVAGDDFMDDAEAEPGSLAWWLGGEKRIKNFRPYGSRDTWAGVSDRDVDPGAILRAP